MNSVKNYEVGHLVVVAATEIEHCRLLRNLLLPHLLILTAEVLETDTFNIKSICIFLASLIVTHG